MNLLGRLVFVVTGLVVLTMATGGCAFHREVAREHPDLLTVAERTDYRATARHLEVVDLLDNLALISPLARRASMGTTGEGREIPLLILADPPVATAAEARARARKDGKLIVLAIGNIHAGEVDGKEALPVLARELVLQKHPKLLRDLIIVIAPIYNADGNERVAKDHRPGQVGPEEGMGIRENARGLDLNRDSIKLESPEAAALVRCFNEWDPHLFIDTHTTNGSLHRYILTYAGAKSIAGDPGLVDFTRNVMFPAIGAAYHAKTGLDTFWYGNFEGEFEGGEPRAGGYTRWETFPAEGRYGTTYYGLRNRLSILTEAYAYATFKERVIATEDFVRCALEFAAANKGRIIRLENIADATATAAGVTPVDRVAIRSKMAKFDEPVMVKGFEEEIRDKRKVSTGRAKDYRVELWDRFIAEKSVARPWAYVIPAPEAGPGGASAKAMAVEALVAKVRQHGIEVERTTADTELDTEAYTVRSAESASRKFQEHVLVKLGVDSRRERVKLPKGSYLVQTGQPLGSLAVYLLEPESEDGLATWNYLDPWATVGAEWPVYRLPAAVSVAAESMP